MKKKLEQELENPENWDFEHAETKEPFKAPRVVVSVAFRNKDFATVSNYAERMGKKVSEFIREAALNTATGKSSTIVIRASGSTGTIWCGNNLPSSTKVQTFEIKREIKEPVVTY